MTGQFQRTMIVSFDFDNTLTKPKKESAGWMDSEFWTTSLDPREEIVEHAKVLASGGHEVHLVTSRSRINSPEVFEFVNEHKLNLEGIHFTDGELKVNKLQELGVEMHFDDAFCELEALEETEIDGKLVLHPFDKDSSRVEEFDVFHKP